MKRLYDYLMQPQATVRLYNHQKEWAIWWVILVVSGTLSMIKWSALGVMSLITFSAIHVFFLLGFAIVIDASAQILGQEGRLKSLIYWLAFAQTIYWLMPSLTIIQSTTLPLGSLFILILHGIYLTFIWRTLKEIYQKSASQLIVILVLPIGAMVLFLIALTIWLTQRSLIL